MIFYYEDESRFSGPWDDAPGWGVQFVLYQDSHGDWQSRSGRDFYIMEDGNVIPCDKWTLVQRAVCGGLKKIKVGSMVDNETWQKIHRQVKEDLKGLNGK